MGDEGTWTWRVASWVHIHTEYTARHHVNSIGSKEAGTDNKQITDKWLIPVPQIGVFFVRVNAKGY